MRAELAAILRDPGRIRQLLGDAPLTVAQPEFEDPWNPADPDDDGSDARRVCDRCQVRWDGGPRCWSCGRRSGRVLTINDYGI